MKSPLARVLDFAVARSKEAHAFFKVWTPQEEGPEIQALFTQFAAAERGRVEMLSRMIPDELVGKTVDVSGLSDCLVELKEPPRLTRLEAVRLAIQRKHRIADLYDRIAKLEGEACSFFHAMAEEDRRTMCALEEYAKRLAADNE